MLLSCSENVEVRDFESENLKIKRVSENSFVHVSYLETEKFGKVACNGLIVSDNGEAIVIDAPVNNKDSEELISWIENDLKSKVVGIVATHFHEDCLGGLDEFHKRNIPSFANEKTIVLASREGVSVPQNGIKDSNRLSFGKETLISEFIGEGHTGDNIISYFPKDKVLFGGCLIKEIGASKGYLVDANVDEWSNSIRKIKTKYNDVEVVVPGHGKHGGVELLNYTEKLFKIN